MAFDRTQGEPLLAIDEIQGDILVGLQKDFERFVGFNIAPNAVGAFKLFLRSQLAPLITSTRTALANEAAVNSKQPQRLNIVSVNVGFSFKGLSALKIADAGAIVDGPFKAGLVASSASLGDPTDPASEGAPANWKLGAAGKEVDGLLLITGPSVAAVDQELQRIQALAGASWTIVYNELGAVRPLDRGHEHFGFLDAVSQPGIRGEFIQLMPPARRFLQDSQNPDDPGQALPGSDLLWPGEFVFGYPGQKQNDIDNPGDVVNGGAAWMQNGSFMALRQLKQLVPEFEQFVELTAASLSTDSDLLGARLIGRWKSGAPASITPLQDDPELAEDPLKRNDFEFDNDPGARRCPFAAHIRKAYPRNDITPAGAGETNDFARRERSEADTQTHRVLRRGIPFGPDRSDEELSGSVTLQARGLMFVSYQTSLSEQFQFIQQNWFNNPDFAPAGGEPGFDPILGQAHGAPPVVRTFKGATPNFPSGPLATALPATTLPRDFVVPIGGGYFFMPSISALKNVLGE